MDHRLVKITQVFVAQVRIVNEAPLAAAVVITPAIAPAWEVNPFGMSEFIAHKVQVSL